MSSIEPCKNIQEKHFTLFLNHWRLNFPPQKGRASVPNIDSKNLSYLVWVRAQLFYIWDKIFLYVHNLWILLFQMIYKWPFFFHVFMEKLAVYDDELHLSILGALSLISTASHFLSLISTLIQNSSKMQSFENKQVFYVFWS